MRCNRPLLQPRAVQQVLQEWDSRTTVHWSSRARGPFSTETKLIENEPWDPITLLSETDHLGCSHTQWLSDSFWSLRNLSSSSIKSPPLNIKFVTVLALYIHFISLAFENSHFPWKILIFRGKGYLKASMWSRCLHMYTGSEFKSHICQVMRYKETKSRSWIIQHRRVYAVELQVHQAFWSLKASIWSCCLHYTDKNSIAIYLSPHTIRSNKVPSYEW